MDTWLQTIAFPNINSHVSVNDSEVLYGWPAQAKNECVPGQRGIELMRFNELAVMALANVFEIKQIKNIHGFIRGRHLYIYFSPAVKGTTSALLGSLPTSP